MADATAWRERLQGARGDAPAWGYRPAGSPAAEPTALAGLALAALGAAGDAAPAGAWLASRQRADGSIAPDGGPEGPGWAAAHAVVLWRALGASHAESRARAAAWLARRRGETMPVTPDQLVGHDTTIPGWPWADATHAFVEPTAWALLALRGATGAAGDRVAAGVRLVADRAVPDGGWNYGNRTVYGRPLRAQPAPTGLALLALAACGADEPRVVGPALAYLGRVAPTLRAPVSLAWALLGLRAWGRAPGPAGALVAAARGRVDSDPTPVPAMALLALAEAPRGLEVLGMDGATRGEGGR